MILNRIRRVTRDGRWIPEIDGLRFVAIASVVLFHLLGELEIRSGRIIPIESRYGGLFGVIGNGNRGVSLFFIISGFAGVAVCPLLFPGIQPGFAAQIFPAPRNAP